MAQPEAYRVLVVDLDPDNVRRLGDAFALAGHEVEGSCSSLTAVKYAGAHPVDVVVLSLDMPGALDVVRALRAADERRYLPVLGVGEETSPQRLSALRAGLDAVVAPPGDPEELLARAAHCVLLRRKVDGLLAETAALHRLAVTDELTQVANHRFFQEKLQEELRRAQRYDDPVSLILIDLDHFKQVNDRHGHPMGDLVLRRVAAQVRASVRETDFVARYGGEEFAVILPKTHLAGSLTVAERVWKDVAALRLGPDGTMKVTASLGISAFPNRAVVSIDQLLRTADEALYRAKREGRNRICLYQHGAAALEQPVRSG